MIFHISSGSIKNLESQSISTTCLPTCPHLWVAGIPCPAARKQHPVLLDSVGSAALLYEPGNLWTLDGGCFCCDIGVAAIVREDQGTGFMLMLAGKSCWQEMTYTCCSCKLHNLLGLQKFMELPTNFLSMPRYHLCCICLELLRRKILGFLNHQADPDPDFHVLKFLMKPMTKAYLFVDNVFIEDRAAGRDSVLS